MVVLEDRFYGWGHPNIKATHKTTLMITKEPYLTLRGDCIVAVKAEKSVADLKPEVKEAIRSKNAEVVFTLELDEFVFEVRGRGSSKLTLDHPYDMVCRRSSYTCSRTLMVNSDKAACDIPRFLVEALRDPSRRILISVKAILGHKV